MRRYLGDLIMIGGLGLAGLGALLLGLPGALLAGGLLVISIGWAVDQRWG